VSRQTDARCHDDGLQSCVARFRNNMFFRSGMRSPGTAVWPSNEAGRKRPGCTIGPPDDHRGV
jgi:hypothetical protein